MTVVLSMWSIAHLSGFSQTNIQFSHNIKTTCCILCRLPLCCQNPTDPWRQRHKTLGAVLSCLALGHLHWIIWVVGWGVRPPWIHLFLQSPQGLVRFRCREFWDQINLEPWALCHIPRVIPRQFLWCGRSQCPTWEDGWCVSSGIPWMPGP